MGGCYIMYIKKPELPAKLYSSLRPVHKVLFNKYYIDELYDKTLVQPTLKAADKIILAFDVNVIEGIVNGVPSLIGLFSRGLRNIQTGLLSNYAVVMAIGVLCVVGYLFFLR